MLQEKNKDKSLSLNFNITNGEVFTPTEFYKLSLDFQDLSINFKKEQITFNKSSLKVTIHENELFKFAEVENPKDISSKNKLYKYLENSINKIKEQSIRQFQMTIFNLINNRISDKYDLYVGNYKQYSFDEPQKDQIVKSILSELER